MNSYIIMKKEIVVLILEDKKHIAKLKAGDYLYFAVTKDSNYDKVTDAIDGVLLEEERNN